ncbi:MAG TPA: hypothetical protein VD969_15970 [Symbiobacteriaceae bacterium]|nr:hypothetical protein [Symbiobacteriaceae bacterium]
MRKHVGPLLMLLLMITACSRPNPTQTPAPAPVQAPAAPVVSELPPARVAAPPHAAESRVSISELPSQP